METAVAAPPAAAATPAPAAPATPAPATPAAASASAASAATETPEVGSPEFFTEALKKSGEAVEAAQSEANKTEDKPQVVEKTAEEKAAEEAAAAAAAGETPEAKAAREAKAAEEARIAAEPAPNQAEIDLGESIAPAALLKSFNEAPEAVKQWWDDPANPLKETLTTMARRAAIADPILREIPDVETAKEVVQTSAKFNKFDNGFNEISTPEGAQQFWEGLWGDFATRNEQGQITGAHPAFQHLERQIFDANANALTKHAKDTGSLSRPLANLTHDALDAIYTAAKKDPNNSDNADLIAAIDTFRELRPRPSDKPAEMTPEQKKTQRELDNRVAAQAKQDSDSRAAAAKTAIETLDGEVNDSISDQIVPVLDAAGLSDFEYENSVLAIDKALTEELEKNEFYKQRRDEYKAAINRNPSKENIAKLKKLELTHRNAKVGRITKEVLAKATAGSMKRQTEKQEKRAAQVERSKTEPRGGATATAAPSSADGNTIEASQALWDAMPENKRPNMEFIDWHFSRIMAPKK